MACRCIPHTQVPYGSRLFADYLYDFSRLSEFYSHNPFKDESFREAARRIPRDAALRAQLVDVLREQNQRLGASKETFANLDKLANPDCIAVVTGHQAGLFTGPAFGLYKGLTAIRLAEELNRRGMPAVPVYWIASEDHDLEEVNHCFIQDREGSPHRLASSAQAPAPNAPVGAVRFDDQIASLLAELKSKLPDSEPAQTLIQVLSGCYIPGETFASAFGKLIAKLFAEFGLILLDPMDRRIHGLSAATLRAAIESGSSLVEAVMQRDGRLTEAGYHAQVHVPENFSFLFIYVNGERRALRLRDGAFVTAQGDRYTKQDLLKRLDNEPESISANVLLRPVMQDTLLPTVAYVGGPSEIAYMAQAGPVYQNVLGRMPVIFPRASFTLLDPHATRLLGKYGLELPDIFAGKQPLRDKMAARFLPPDLIEMFEKTSGQLERSLQAIQNSLTRLDPTLADAAANSGKKMHYQLSTLEHKAKAAIQNRSEQMERDASRLENGLYPQKAPQERVYSGVSFLARYGPAMLRQLCDQIPLHVAQHQVIEV